MTGTPQERFDAKYQPEPMTGCWLWTAALDTWGYGRFYDGRLRQAHRWAYEQKHGPVPPVLDVDHKCRVRACVNPAHLRAVSRRDNLLCGETLPAAEAKRTHCPRGHAYDYTWRGQRHCRTCRNKRGLDHYYARKGRNI